MDINKIILNNLEKKGEIWLGPMGNYWSNLNIEENKKFLNEIDVLGVEASVKKYYPEYFDVIFSPKRAAGLLFLDPRPGEIVLDAGCMWGALTLPLAKTGCDVIGIDQTYESLVLLNKRLSEEKLYNVNLICSDLTKIFFQKESFDKAIINGVMEWIPQNEVIELKKYYGKRSLPSKNENNSNPRDLQLEFLKTIQGGLKKKGTLYLAIENRYDILYFLGVPDPHCNLKFITFMPRFIQNVLSKIFLGRPYTNWIYSPYELKKLVKEAGFNDIEIYSAFPNYHQPEYILSANGMKLLRPFSYTKINSKLKRAVMYGIEEIIYRKLKLTIFAPSLIIIAQKG